MIESIIQNQIKNLSDGQTKALLIIWLKTIAVNKKSAKITNYEFISIGGKSLANKPAVVNATNALDEMGIIYKVLDDTDSINFYCINEDFEGVTIL